MNITEFLEARIAEDEERAGSGWTSMRETRWETDNYGRNFLTPSAVLAECAAKRAIMSRHIACDDVSYGDASTCPEMRALAAVYNDHPNYDPAWALTD